MFRLFRKHEPLEPVETDEQISERLLKLCEDGDYGLCPPPMDAKVAIVELSQFFLGEDWCVCMPLSPEQVISEIVYQIETKYKDARHSFMKKTHSST